MPDFLSLRPVKYLYAIAAFEKQNEWSESSRVYYHTAAATRLKGY
jgi:hypothetical protein